MPVTIDELKRLQVDIDYWKTELDYVVQIATASHVTEFMAESVPSIRLGQVKLNPGMRGLRQALKHAVASNADSQLAAESPSDYKKTVVDDAKTDLKHLPKTKRKRAT